LGKESRQNEEKYAEKFITAICIVFAIEATEYWGVLIEDCVNDWFSRYLANDFAVFISVVIKEHQGKSEHDQGNEEEEKEGVNVIYRLLDQKDVERCSFEKTKL